MVCGVRRISVVIYQANHPYRCGDGTIDTRNQYTVADVLASIRTTASTLFVVCLFVFFLVGVRTTIYGVKRYEVLKDTLNPDNGYNPSSHMIAGGGAGALAAAITNPFDVAKTLLNTQEQSGVRGVAPAFRAVYNGSGYGGFLKGLSARVALAAPATAVSWTVYEFFKHVLPGHAHDINSEEKCC